MWKMSHLILLSKDISGGNAGCHFSDRWKDDPKDTELLDLLLVP